jgi:hypothetical protein
VQTLPIPDHPLLPPARWADLLSPSPARCRAALVEFILPGRLHGHSVQPLVGPIASAVVHILTLHRDVAAVVEPALDALLVFSGPGPGVLEPRLAACAPAVAQAMDRHLNAVGLVRLGLAFLCSLAVHDAFRPSLLPLVAVVQRALQRQVRQQDVTFLCTQLFHFVSAIPSPLSLACVDSIIAGVSEHTRDVPISHLAMGSLNNLAINDPDKVSVMRAVPCIRTALTLHHNSTKVLSSGLQALCVLSTAYDRAPLVQVGIARISTH